MALFLSVLLGLLLVVFACRFYFHRKSANGESETRSYSRETSEARKKNRKADSAAVGEGARTSTVKAQSVNTPPVEGISSSSFSSNRIADALFLGSMACLAARSANSSSSSSLLKSAADRKDATSSLRNDELAGNPEAWSEGYPKDEDEYEERYEEGFEDESEYEDGFEDGAGYEEEYECEHECEDTSEEDYEAYSYDGDDDYSDGWEDGYEDGSDW